MPPAERVEQMGPLVDAGVVVNLLQFDQQLDDARVVRVHIRCVQRLQQLAELNLVKARAQRYVVTVNLFVAAGGGLADTPKQMAVAR